MSEETKPVNEEIRAAYDARMSAIADLRAIDQEIGEGPVSEEQRAKIDRANAAVDLNDEKIERGFRKQELEAHSAKLDALVGVSSQPCSPVFNYVFDVLFVEAAIARFGDV